MLRTGWRALVLAAAMGILAGCSGMSSGTMDRSASSHPSAGYGSMGAGGGGGGSMSGDGGGGGGGGY